MILNKKNLFLGIIIGAVGNSLYKLIKKPNKSSYINEHFLNPPINNATTFSKLNKNDIKKHFNQLKKQTNLLEEKLNKLKNWRFIK